MSDRLTDFVHKCMKHGGVEGSASFAKPNGYSVLASTDTLTFDVEVQDDHVVDFFYSGRGDLTDEERKKQRMSVKKILKELRELAGAYKIESN